MKPPPSSGNLVAVVHESQALAEQGRLSEALMKAQDAYSAYMAASGDIHVVAFRIRSTTEVLTGVGTLESVLVEPTAVAGLGGIKRTVIHVPHEEPD
jgi:hypothetical protein